MNIEHTLSSDYMYDGRIGFSHSVYYHPFIVVTRNVLWFVLLLVSKTTITSGGLCFPTFMPEGGCNTTDGSIFRPVLSIVENLKFKLEV